MADRQKLGRLHRVFDNAVHIDAVTYCESPELLLDLFDQDNAQLETMDVLVGNREEYQSSVDDKTVARPLERCGGPDLKEV